MCACVRACVRACVCVCVCGERMGEGTPLDYDKAFLFMLPMQLMCIAGLRVTNEAQQQQLKKESDSHPISCGSDKSGNVYQS